MSLITSSNVMSQFEITLPEDLIKDLNKANLKFKKDLMLQEISAPLSSLAEFSPLAVLSANPITVQLEKTGNFLVKLVVTGEDS